MFSRTAGVAEVGSGGGWKYDYTILLIPEITHCRLDGLGCLWTQGTRKARGTHLMHYRMLNRG